MALSIITKKRFANKVRKLLEYLLLNWYDQVADDFLMKLDEKMLYLLNNPFIGRRENFRPDVRSYLVTKHNRVYYRITDETIIFINMIDTRQNPAKNPFK